MNLFHEAQFVSQLHHLTLLIQYGLSEKRSHVLKKHHQKMTMATVAGQCYNIGFLKSQKVTQKGIILNKTIKRPTFTMKVLCTPLHYSQKRKMNFSFRIPKILKLLTC